MIVIILAFVYITPLCWVWGFWLQDIFCNLLKAGKTEPLDFPITCFIGLSALGVIGSLLSLFIPLGGILAQAIILLPALAIFTFKQNTKRYLGQQLKRLFNWNYKPAAFFCLLTVVLILIMNTWQINHPDTLGYHLQTVKWIANYPAVPGIALLNIRLGYQGLWYLLCALFGFGFTGTAAPTFINSTLAMWFLLFIFKGIDNSLNKKQSENIALGPIYFLLLGIATVDFGQLRLMATSLSPDFVACLYVLLIFHLSSKKEDAIPIARSRLLVFFLCLVAITVKLSVIPVFIFSMYQGFKLIAGFGKKMILFLGLLLAFCLIPFFIRNIISSGYPAFPSVFPNPIKTEWQITEQETRLEKDYIKAYARTGPVSGENSIKMVASSPLSNWMPTWWQQKPFPEKAMLVCCVVALLICLMHLKSCFTNADIGLPLTIAVIGIIFWFLNAPDPRFAYGFLLIPPGLCIRYFILPSRLLQKYSQKILRVGVGLGSIVILAYTGHRLAHFFKPANFIYPEGAQVVPYKTIGCNTFSINVPLKGFASGNTALPCSISENCDAFGLRTNNIKDGFKAVKK
jgi:hypothetical protein